MPNNDSMNLDSQLAEGWRPSEGDTVVGVVTEIHKGWDSYREGYYPILVVKRDSNDEEVAIHAFHAVLRNRILELKPNIGERIGAKYVGKKPNKSNPKNETAIYVFKVEGRGATDPYSDMANRETTRRPISAKTPNLDLVEREREEESDDLPF